MCKHTNYRLSKKLSEKSFPIKIIYNKTKLGYGKSNNIGVEHSQGIFSFS